MATLSSSEVTQPEIMKEVLQGLCRPVGGPALRSLIDAHFDDSLVLKNPLFSVKGKDQLYHLFHAWSGLFDDRVQVLDVATHGSKILCKVRHNLLLRPFHMAKHTLPALAADLLTVPFIVNSEIETVQTARGLRISSWVEDVSVYTLIFNLVWPTKLFNFWDFVETAVGQGIVVADQVASKGYHILQPMLAPHAERALQGTDRLLKERLGLDAGLHSASSKFWA
eukprot:GHRQ01001279.1.p1 GENE.GHRQ01001279.1~~GHRQ01001279.1.p1  ORF type:complete len:224 (+),score=103.48 GHRQ01001279.1:145-816(+)